MNENWLHVMPRITQPNPGDVLVTGSWRSDDPLETWDFGTGKKIASVDWFKSEMSGQSCMLYAAQFSKDNYTNGYADKPKFIAAGGSGANEARGERSEKREYESRA